MADSRTTGALGGAAQGAAAGATLGPYGAIIGGGVGAVGGLLSGGGEDEAKKLAEIQAKYITRTADENIRRLRIQMEETVGYTDAAIYASNLQMSGSPRRYRDQLESRFRQDMAWERAKAGIEARMAEKGGQIAAQQIEAMGVQSAISGFGAAAQAGLFGSYSKAGGYRGPFS